MQSPPRLRGFTLIELMVALTMALVITSSALGLMLAAIETQKEGAARQTISRDLQLVMDTLQRDLEYLGVGVPRGFAIDTDGDILGLGGARLNSATQAQLISVADSQLRPAVRTGQTNYLAFIGDLPFPQSDFNGVSQIGMIHGSSSSWPSVNHRFAITSELSTCSAPGGGSANYNCQTTQNTMVPVGGGNCSGSNITEPTCPWGLGKYGLASLTPGMGGLGEVPLVIGVLDGSWMPRNWRGGMASEDDRAMLHLEHDAPTGGTGTDNQDISSDLIVQDRVGSGFVSHIDRVFYSATEAGGTGPCPAGGPCTLHRKQCWAWNWVGGTSPSAANFPAVGAGPIGVNNDPADCAAPNEGTPWEAIMDSLYSFQLRYFDSTGAELTPPLNAELASRTRVIEVAAEIERPIKRDGPLIRMGMTRRFYLEHAGGIVSWPTRVPLANGGCWDTGPANECNPQ